MTSDDQLLNTSKILRNTLMLQPGDHVADLGAGTAAFFTMEAARIVTDSGQVHAVDILKKVLENIESRAKLEDLPNITTHWSNLEKFGALKINDESLDAAFLVNTLFQNRDFANVFKEATRLLSSGGKLLVIEWAPGRFPLGPKQEEKVSPETVREHAAKEGLVELQTFEAGKYHYGIIFQK